MRRGPIRADGIHGRVGYVVAEVQRGAERQSGISRAGHRSNLAYKEWNVV
ncbi:hypothetical protein LINGRAHAP2_LOCUS16603 [Linum grandiflorum]